eukprot:CAMPEP_0178921716 /NCGR_PEP_ID=MMETSP0786-20121207/15722_1 /TAXON_ID=186022 /ORGANISM="Thalassionema frauenfeldii, Strain CCMP 1798" /LENGTH=219 /DNA_ID=CAMNT_0020595939 /DNA_START=34 /DNA_END=693 /DNA_ORIENTATION=+
MSACVARISLFLAVAVVIHTFIYYPPNAYYLTSGNEEKYAEEYAREHFGGEKSPKVQPSSTNRKIDKESYGKKQTSEDRIGKPIKKKGIKTDESHYTDKKVRNKTQVFKDKEKTFVNDEPVDNSVWWVGFIGSSDATTISIEEGCTCELISIDCLDTIECLLSAKGASELTYKGMLKRETIKEMVTFIDATFSSWHLDANRKIIPITNTGVISAVGKAK